MQYQFIPNPSNLETKRWVIGDVHGCSQTLRALVNQLEIRKDDQLFLLGDYIDRGPDSAGVLDYILELFQEDKKVYALRGNHEQMLLNAYETSEKDDFLHYVELNGLESLLSNSQKLKTNYHLLLNSLSYLIELDKIVLVHAGLNFSHLYPLKDFESMLWLRNTRVHLAPEFHKTIIHGHTVNPLAQIKKAATKKQQVIPLDNGCVFKNRLVPAQEYGQLCALNLDTFELITQENIDI